MMRSVIAQVDANASGVGVTPTRKKVNWYPNRRVESLSATSCPVKYHHSVLYPGCDQ